MIWALLITLLIRALSGGPEEIFMIPKLEKEIKTHITDKDRKKEILQIVKEVKKEIKEFGKLRKKKLKETKKMGSSREVSSDDMFEVFETYHNSRLNLQSSVIENRLALQELFTDEEWKFTIEKAVLPSEKAMKKIDKQEGKVEKNIDKLNTDIRENIVEHIEDENKRSNVLVSLDNYQTTLDAFIEEGQQMNFEDNNLVRNKNVTRNELEQFYKKQNQLRIKGAKEYMLLRDAVIENTNEEEWKSIIKALNKFIKG